MLTANPARQSPSPLPGCRPAAAAGRPCSPSPKSSPPTRALGINGYEEPASSSSCCSRTDLPVWEARRRRALDALAGDGLLDVNPLDAAAPCRRGRRAARCAPHPGGLPPPACAARGQSVGVGAAGQECPEAAHSAEPGTGSGPGAGNAHGRARQAPESPPPTDPRPRPHPGGTHPGARSFSARRRVVRQTAGSPSTARRCARGQRPMVCSPMS